MSYLEKYEKGLIKSTDLLTLACVYRLSVNFHTGEVCSPARLAFTMLDYHDCVYKNIEQELDLCLKELKDMLMDHLNDLTPAEQGEVDLPELLKMTIEIYQDNKV